MMEHEMVVVIIFLLTVKSSSPLSSKFYKFSKSLLNLGISVIIIFMFSDMGEKG